MGTGNLSRHWEVMCRQQFEYQGQPRSCGGEQKAGRTGDVASRRRQWQKASQNGDGLNRRNQEQKAGQTWDMAGRKRGRKGGYRLGRQA